MKLYIKNIGKIYKETSIEFNGITLVAGENGVGKSTIGKVLYCIYDSFYDTKDQILAERKRAVKNILRRYLVVIDEFRKGLNTEFVDQIMQLDICQMTKDDFKSALISIMPKAYEATGSRVDEMIDNLYETLKVSDDRIRSKLLYYRLMEEFRGNIGNVNVDNRDSEIRLTVKNEEINVAIADKEVSIVKYTDIIKQIVYFDDLSALELDNRMFGYYYALEAYSHSGNLIKHIAEVRENKSAVEDILASERFEKLMAVMTSIGVGELNMTTQGEFEYKSNDLKRPISYKNLSSGTKVFAILKKLILDGRIGNKGIVIFDEPEVHLHPEWQKTLAELIVLMQAVLDVTVLLSTHSADFTAFLEYYSRKYQIESKCKYYILSDVGENIGSTVTDVTENTDEIYKSLGQAFVRVSEELGDE